MLDRLNLPEYLREQFVHAEGTLRWYSPGYSSDPNEPDRLRRVGGIEAEGVLRANLFDVFDAMFAGSLDSSGSYSFAADDLSFTFPFGVGAIAGNADFHLAGTIGSSDIDFQGEFTGTLKVGKTNLASVSATIDPYGCLQGTLAYQNPLGKLGSLEYPLQLGACGAHASIEDAVVTEADADAAGSVLVRLTEPAINDVVIFYSVEPIWDSLDPRDKATSSDVSFHAQQQTVTIPRGQLQAAISVTIQGDDAWETDEIFRVRIVNVLGATLADDIGIVTIVDDDLENLVDNVLAALEPSARAIVWFDFQDDNNTFDTTADDAPPVITSTTMAHSLGLEVEGRAGLPDQNSTGRGASSTLWSNNEAYFEFTVTFDHDEPLDVQLDHLQFWDRTTSAGSFNQRYVGPQQWQVLTSLDGFQAPLTRQQSIAIDRQFFDQHNLPSGTTLDELLGWRRQRFVLENALVPGYVPELPLVVTFRMVGLQDIATIIDNVELSGRVLDPCESNLELQCVVHEFGDTLRWLDSLVGTFDVTILGPGVFDAVLAPRGDDSDPTRYQELITLDVIGGDPEQTTVLIEVERPGDLPAGATLPLGTIRSENGLFRLDLSGVPSCAAQIESAGPLQELALDSLASGSRIAIGGTAEQLTSITASGDIGTADGVGADLASSGTVAVVGKSWLGGSWNVAAVTTAEFLSGDFSPSVAIAGSFGEFTVLGGDFASPSFASGLAPGAGDGTGILIQARSDSHGTGGSILVGQLSIDGDLTALEAVGGKVSTQLTAQKVGTIRATRESLAGDAGNIEGTIQAASLDLMQSVGGDITATLVTSDAAHSTLRVEAFADSRFPGNGRIDSRRSFHVAGGIEAIRAHDILLRLWAGERVELVELLDEGGTFQSDLTARSFGLIQGRTSSLDVDLRTLPSEQPPHAGSLVWDVIPNATAALLDFRITDPARQTAWKFTVDENGQPQIVELEQLAPALVDENVSGGTIGAIGVPTTWNGEPLTISISDPRFELRNGQLALKVNEFMQANTEGGELVEVSTSSPDGTSRFLETFVISIDENPFPWHHKQLPWDVSDNGFVSPLDVLIVIDYLNTTQLPQLPAVRPAAESGRRWWYDVSADGFVSPRDVLLVIDHLNRQGAGEGEGDLRPVILQPMVAAEAKPLGTLSTPLAASAELSPQIGTSALVQGARQQPSAPRHALRVSASDYIPTGSYPHAHFQSASDRDGAHQIDNWLEEILDDLTNDLSTRDVSVALLASFCSRCTKPRLGSADQ